VAEHRGAQPDHERDLRHGQRRHRPQNRALGQHDRQHQRHRQQHLDRALVAAHAGERHRQQIVHHLGDGVGHVEHVADHPQSALNHRSAAADGCLGERVETAGGGDLL
jgi:hypothetical protein